MTSQIHHLETRRFGTWS